MRRAIILMAIGALAVCGCGSSASTTATSTSSAPPKPSTSTSHSHLTVDQTPAFASPPPSAPVLSGLVKVSYRNFAINPDVVRVHSGATIEWTNNDPTDHNVTGESGPQPFASKNFGEGATFRVHLSKPGIYHYECTLHPATMNGTIQVLR
jgi:plastocyanin